MPLLRTLSCEPFSHCLLFFFDSRVHVFVRNTGPTYMSTPLQKGVNDTPKWFVWLGARSHLHPELLYDM